MGALGRMFALANRRLPIHRASIHGPQLGGPNIDRFSKREISVRGGAKETDPLTATFRKDGELAQREAIERLRGRGAAPPLVVEGRTSGSPECRGEGAEEVRARGRPSSG